MPRAGQGRKRCRRDGIFVDGVKVFTAGSNVLWYDGQRVRNIHPQSLHRIMGSHEGPIDVLIVPKGATALPSWFTNPPHGTPVWKGQVHPDAGTSRGRRRTRNIRYWDDRNLLSCANYIVRNPDPSIPEHQLLTAAALAAAETGKVSFVRRRHNLEAIVRAGENSTPVKEDLAILRTIVHGTDSHPLEATSDRRTLRNRAGRLLHQNEAVAQRLERAIALDRSGAALTVAAAFAQLDSRRTVTIAATLAASIGAAGVASLIAGPEGARWAWRTLATLSVFARGNVVSANILNDRRPSSSEVRQERFDLSWRMLSHTTPDDTLAGAAKDSIEAAFDTPGNAKQRTRAALHEASDKTVGMVRQAAEATAELARTRNLTLLAINLASATTLITVHAELAESLSSSIPQLDEQSAEIASGSILAAGTFGYASARSPGGQLASVARGERKGWKRSLRRLEKIRSETHTYRQLYSLADIRAAEQDSLQDTGQDNTPDTAVDTRPQHDAGADATSAAR